jgi:hypothetical protein
MDLQLIETRAAWSDRSVDRLLTGLTPEELQRLADKLEADFIGTVSARFVLSPAQQGSLRTTPEELLQQVVDAVRRTAAARRLNPKASMRVYGVSMGSRCQGVPATHINIAPVANDPTELRIAILKGERAPAAQPSPRPEIPNPGYIPGQSSNEAEKKELERQEQERQIDEHGIEPGDKDHGGDK